MDVKVVLRLASLDLRLNPRPSADYLSAMKRRHTIEAQNQRLWLTLERLLMERKNKPETAEGKEKNEVR
jgi:hypothetical protein